MPQIKESSRPDFHDRLKNDTKATVSVNAIRRQEEERQAQREAERLGIPYMNLQFIPVSPEALLTLSKEQALKSEMAVFQRAGNNAKIALANLQNPLTKKVLQQFYAADYSIELFFVSRSSLQKAFTAYDFIRTRSTIVKDQLVVTTHVIEDAKANLDNLGHFASKLEKVEISDFIQMICAGALASEASDIHIEPKGQSSRLRFRIDGVLQDVLHFSSDLYKPLLSRIKNLASLILNIKTTSQDGRFSIIITDLEGATQQTVDVRVSILPGKNGEIIVLRLLNVNIHSLDLYDFGIRPVFLDIILRNIQKPQGLIMLSGPTGSGKTTSLYSFLNYINRTDTNIITIEDPIEYRLPNINQTQVDKKKGYTFANGLKAMVRQDPDVIMVGEIRDTETADIAVNAAITGHLVFSTIHTNDSVGIVTRLSEFDVDRTLIVSSMNIFIAQRLLRRLCSCKEPHIPTEEEREKIEHALAVISPKAGIPIPKNISTLYKPVGCPECLGIGYKGRFAIYELFEARDDIRQLISDGEPEFKIFRKALENGMVSLFQDGILHALSGETSIQEVLEVAGDTAYIEELYEESLTSMLSRGIHIDPSLSLDIKELTETLPAKTQLSIIAKQALLKRATDIHLEPAESTLIIRFRIDGILYEEASVPKSLYPQILTQVKIFAGIPLDIANQIQEGRFTIFDIMNYDVRLSIIPGGYGQTIVMRILRSDISSLSLTDLGMDDYNRDILTKQLKSTSGLILVTGPTSAGKSTTLYASLNTLNQPGVKIITIEDPIEYKLPGILQTSINTDTGYTFPNAIRALLRQNPNIVLIGEIRDSETAKVAMQTAATGHLLLSTLHTNDAPSAILRLYDLGIGLQEIATFVNATVAQRIIRKVDSNSAKTITLSQSQKDLFKQRLPQRYHDQIPDTILEAYPSEENPTGYFGITAIFEIFVISPTVQTAITAGKSAPELKSLAIEEGMNTLEISGILKIFEKITDISEVERVLGISLSL